LKILGAFKVKPDLDWQKKLVIQVEEIPEGGRTLDVTIEQDWFSEIIEKNLFWPAEHIPVSVKIERQLKNVLVKGTLRTAYGFMCSRCGEETRTENSLELYRIYGLLPNRAGSLEDENREQESLEFSYYEGSEIKLEEFLRESLAFHFPMAPLCKADCKGLCPVCGTNLNMETCTCDRNKTDPRWSALKEIKIS
jgi:uncharacterized protein